MSCIIIVRSVDTFIQRSLEFKEQHAKTSTTTTNYIVTICCKGNKMKIKGILCSEIMSQFLK